MRLLTSEEQEPNLEAHPLPDQLGLQIADSIVKLNVLSLRSRAKALRNGNVPAATPRFEILENRFEE